MNDTYTRFISKVVCVSGHWLWVGSLRNGYGQFWYEGQPQGAHRASYKMFVGSLTESDVIHHKCNITRCVRPMCLEKTDDIGNAAARRLNYCLRGHNISIVGRTSGRSCKECAREDWIVKKLRQHTDLSTSNAANITPQGPNELSGYTTGFFNPYRRD